ncbi:hypothetical protein O181_079429 [Austropuccinia psidii MF-1]|uniref:Uncharacterized protein n=1 Tax=Austropuccinia psidii MF-1 TaxID=1389203 RepID=A0A9Q3FIG7_9BASI|nr:hypothetical protein [Austropuccinia psidii MF-1]
MLRGIASAQASFCACTAQWPPAGPHSPAPPFTSAGSNYPSFVVPPTSLPSNSPTSASVSPHTAQPHTTIVPSIPLAVPHSIITLSTPHHSHESLG